MRAAGYILAFVMLVVASEASARDDWLMFPLRDALNSPTAQQRLDQGIRFYFGDQKHPKVAKTLGQYMSNKKTNAFNKSDKEACEWAFLSALLSFQERALQLGGDAVIDITSYYKKHSVRSSTEYECGAGAFMAGVTFQGTVVKLAR